VTIDPDGRTERPDGLDLMPAELAAELRSLVGADQVVVPDWGLAPLLTRPREDLLAPLGGRLERRVVPTLDDWGCRATWTAAPALVVHGADPAFRPPAGTVALGPVPTEGVRDPDVTWRRWIALRIALVLPAGEVPTPGELLPGRLLPAGLPAPSAWTDDVRRAVAGLCAEYAPAEGRVEGSVDGWGIPGLRGPDAAYA
jgi:hypothetical protein